MKKQNKEIKDKKKKEKVFSQCGYEDRCKNKECLKCPRKTWIEIRISLAEAIAAEDFAVCDLTQLIKEKPEEVELMQKLMFRLMTKIYKNEDMK